MKHICYILVTILTVLFSNISFAESPVFMDNLVDAIVESEKNNKPILLVFSADWCKYCNILKNDIADNLDEFNNYIICYADYDENRDIVKEYRVRTIPHSIILVNKTEKSTKVGYKNIKDYVNWKNNATK